MGIVPGTLGVFWTRPGYGVCFHADLGLMPGESPREALARYRAMYPQDQVIGAKDKSGRWVA
jgi:hypothetical protein